MACKLLIDDMVAKDLKTIDIPRQKKIIEAIKTKLVENPYTGKKLVGDLSPYYRYRVGDYRVIYEIIDEEVTVIVIRIRHRKEVYR